jgi:hypothetical protein
MRSPAPHDPRDRIGDHGVVSELTTGRVLDRACDRRVRRLQIRVLDDDDDYSRWRLSMTGPYSVVPSRLIPFRAPGSHCDTESMGRHPVQLGSLSDGTVFYAPLGEMLRDGTGLAKPPK